MPLMAEEDNTPQTDISFAEIDLPKIVDEEEPNSSPKALVPFDPLQRYLAEIAVLRLLIT